MTEKESKNKPKGGRKDCQFPPSRIRIIMKSSPNVENISQDALFLVTKCTELFVQHMSELAILASDSNTKVEYNDVANVVDWNDNLKFLSELIPAKKTGKEAREMLEKLKAENNAAVSDSSSDDES